MVFNITEGDKRVLFNVEQLAFIMHFMWYVDMFGRLIYVETVVLMSRDGERQ